MIRSSNFCHSEAIAEESAVTVRRQTLGRFFAEPALERSEGLRMTKTHILVFLLIACSLSACTSTPSPRSQQIVFGAPWEPISFHPQRGLDSASYYAQSLVYEALVGYDDQLHFVPALAESFSVSPDGKKYAFTLRKDLHFSDSTPLTLADVVATLNVARAKESPYRADFADIEKMEEHDNKLVLYLSRPCAPLLSRIAELRVLPAVYLNKADKGVLQFATKPIASGPFYLAGWKSGLELVFKRNKYYWGNTLGKGAQFEELVWRVVPDKYLMALALKNRELDVAQIDPASWQHYLDKTDVKLASFNGSRTVYLAFNLNQSPFNDTKVRQAVSMAINKKAMMDKLYEGFAEPASSDFPSSSWVYNAQTKQWPYEPAQSINMLKSTGVNNLAFSILTINDYQDQALIIADNLRKAGIKTEVHIAEYSTLRQRYLKKGQFQTCLLSRSTGPDPECILNWGSGGSFNFCRFSDKRVDELLDVGRRSMVPSERKHTYEEIQAILADEQPFVFLLQPKLLIAHQPDILSVSTNTNQPLPWDNPVFNARRWSRRP